MLIANISNRTFYYVFGLILLIIATGYTLGLAYTMRMLAEISCYALIALALSLQWGYAGLFNAGIMGFIAIGGFSMLLTVSPNTAFWQSDYPFEFLKLFLFASFIITANVFWKRLAVIPKPIKSLGSKLIPILGIIIVVPWFLQITSLTEADFGFIGGLNIHPTIAWIIGGILAGLVGWGVGRICLDLRSDYLAIATLGIAELIKHIFKNADWLTNGVQTVSPLPWATPGPAEIGFIYARGLYFLIVVVFIVILFWLLHHGYHSPWGRMIRAIRDNETAAKAMGKFVNKRRLECFIIGSAIMGFAGSLLVNFNSIFDPSGFLPLNHTFLIWIMVILGGAGNNFGVIFGTTLVYIFWNLSESISLSAFTYFYDFGHAYFDWEIPSSLNARALQMRVFVVGLVIILVLRFSPNGIFPEKPPKND